MQPTQRQMNRPPSRTIPDDAEQRTESRVRSRQGRGLRIGLLGGSFNPAHDGHRHISTIALHRLGLDQVWWLVSPQNPLKSPEDMAPFEERFRSAEQVSRHPRILVSDIERRLGTSYTIDTMRALTRRFPRHHFVWLMGADNLRQIPFWKDWTWVFRTVPVAVFARPTYSLKALSGKAAWRFRRYRLPERDARKLKRMRPPVWCFLHIRLHPQSATQIREERKREKQRRAVFKRRTQNSGQCGSGIHPPA
ncbi:MAG: nicotinate-nucleotide adenylyltransferase [Alphaproteobacteria bacterium]